MYKLGWLTSSSPLYVSKLPDWKHRDAILPLLMNKGVEIHVPIPQVGSPEMMDRLYKGDTKVLYHTLRDLGIHWYPEIRKDLKLDGIFLDGVSYFQDIVLGEGILSAEEQELALWNILDDMVYRDKPIVISDNDMVCTRDFIDGQTHMLTKVYNYYKGYKKFHILSPMMQELPGNVSYHHIPFEIDPDTINPTIVPAVNRRFLAKYVGNNYFKTDTHIPVFNKLSKLGRVSVNGSRWTKEDKQLAPYVEWGPAVTLSHDNIHKTYCDSILGLSGYGAKQPRSLYHLRWKEFLIGGIYIVTEDTPTLAHLLPEDTLSFDYIRETPSKQLTPLLNNIVAHYVELVEAQREQAIDFFRADKWLHVYTKVFEIE